MTWDEKIAKAEETAVRKAEKDGLDETATKEVITIAVQKILDAKVKTENREEEKETGSVYIVSVDENPSFCGVGAGGIQFANGRAEITSKRMKTWFEEHEGYTVQAKE